YNNRLSGTIPSSLGNLSLLKVLRLHNNRLLTGTIPSSLGNLSLLEDLYLSSTGLTGSIPSSLGNLSKLKRLSLSHTGLSGTIPGSLGNLSQLELLVLYNVGLSGTVPSSLGNLSKLDGLFLGNNSLTGELPDNLTKLGLLSRFRWIGNDGLCAPTDDDFQVWLADVRSRGYTTGPDCTGISIDNVSVRENAGQASLRVTQSPALEETVTVGYATSDGTASAGQDYRSTSGTLTIPAGETEAHITVDILNDLEVESNETFTVTLTDPVGADLSRATATVTIVDEDESNEAVTMSIADMEVLEDAGPASLRVSLRSTLDEVVSVCYAMSDGTATAGQDYRSTSGTLTIPAGETEAHITVDILNDLKVESNETFTVTLTDPVGVSLSHATATVTIIDDDLPVVSIDDVVVAENIGQAVFTVRLDTPFTVPVRALYATVDGTATAAADYIPISGELTILPGESSVDVTVVVIDDDFFESNETFTVVLSSPAGAVLGDGTGEGTIIDDEATPTLGISDVTVREDAGSAVFTVRLSGRSAREVRANYATSDQTATGGIDYTETSGTVQFAPGEVEQRIVVPVLEDDLEEPDETFLVRLSGVVNAEIEDGVGRGTITDNDEPPLTISVDDARALEDAGVMYIPVQLSRPASAVVSVFFASSDITAEEGLDYTATRGIVVFRSGSTKGLVGIKVKEDALTEGDETFHVTLSRPRNAVIARGVATGTIGDNEGMPHLRVDDILVREDGEEAIFTVWLSLPSTRLVTVAYRSVDGTAMAGADYEETSGTVAFAPGEMQKKVGVRLLRGKRDWRGETFTLVLTSASNAQLEDAEAMATIVEAEKVESGVLTAHLARFARTSAGHVVEAVGERLREVPPVCAPVAGSWLQMTRIANPHWKPSVGELLAGCGLLTGSATGRGAFSVWGRGAFTRFSGREGVLSLQADVTTASIGADYRWDSGLLAGLLLSHSGATGTYAADASEGETGSSLTGVYPYVSYRLSSSDLWVLAGLGRGSAQVSGTERVEADVDAGLVAAGATGTLAEGGAARLSYTADAFVVRAAAKDLTRVRASQLRAGLEGSVLVGRTLRPYVEAALRRDGGDAETGLGLEVGGGVRLVPPGGRIRAEVRARGLVTHVSAGFTEWGVAATLRYRAANGLGPTAELRPVWGPGRFGGMDALWRHASVADAAIGASGQQRMELLLGYGLARSTGVTRPVFGVTLREGGREYQLGYEVKLENGLSLSASGTVRGRDAPEQLATYGISTRATLRW
ncbi:MAG: hypothetical protein F4069_02985, partial [Rhodothermaceae bacterium]|nr:hypothetical protein [Rhodothermaceae bacterium]